jgi:hypothetical protein
MAVTNTIGNAVAAIVVGKQCGQLDRHQLDDELGGASALKRTSVTAFAKARRVSPASGGGPDAARATMGAFNELCGQVASSSE